MTNAKEIVSKFYKEAVDNPSSLEGDFQELGEIVAQATRLATLKEVLKVLRDELDINAVITCDTYKWLEAKIKEVE